MAGTSWLEDYRRRVQEIGVRAERACGALGRISATATAGAGAVTVTVSAEGALQRISFGASADELSRPLLAEMVLEATQQARTEAALRAGEALDELLGDTGAARFVASRHPGGAQ
jgi:DNA-binding protein YbaB